MKAKETSHWYEAFSFGCLGISLLLWVTALPEIDPSRITDYGLVSALPWQFWSALVIASFGFAASLRPEITVRTLPLHYLIALVIILHLTPAIVYQEARYPWVWKHFGIVDFIRRHGVPDRSSEFLQAYQNWPGLFYVSARLSDLLGIDMKTFMAIARYAPPLFEVAFVLALVPIYQQFGGNFRLTWLAVWIFLTGNWIGQDYYSPQAAAFLLYLIVISLCLGPLRSTQVWTRNAKSRLLALVGGYINTVQRNHPALRSSTGALSRVLISGVVLLAIMAIVATHQLTPIVLILALSALFLIGQLNAGFVIFACVAEIYWLLYPASPYVADHLAEQFGSLGEGLAVASTRFVDVSLVSAGQWWVVMVGRAIALSIGLAALFGGIRRLRTGNRDVAAAVLTLAPFPVLAIGYGGEVLFRVYMFALPFLSFFAATAFFPTVSHGHSWFLRATVGLICLLMSGGFLLANDGKDLRYTFSGDEVSAWQWLAEHAPPGTLLIEGARDYPSQFRNYENFSYVPIDREGREQRTAILADPVGVFAGWMSDPRWKTSFIIITRGQKRSTEEDGTLPRGALDGIEQALLVSPRFILVHMTADARIFALHPSVGSMGKWADRK